MPDMMEMDDAVFAHAMLDQLEGRFTGGQSSLRYDGFGWIGGDIDKLWIQSEGRLEPGGRFADASHEILFDHAISTRLDLQAGLRADLDGASARYWAALGLQGTMAYFLDMVATAYAGTDGRLAARVKASTDLLVTQRLILQPEAEINLYDRPDPARHLAAGCSEIDAGFRLRYEIDPKFAPYIGAAYQNMDRVGWRLALGLRGWI